MSLNLSTGAGALLGALSLWGVVHGVRAGVAQADYRTAKYGAAHEDVWRVLATTERAHRLYPRNYYLCLWTAERALDAASKTRGGESLKLRQAAQRWCDTGLGLNVYHTDLRLVKTRLLLRDSAAEAVRYWQAYVDWDFWDPSHHAVLIDLYARNGDFAEAMAAMRWVEGSAYEADARERIRAAWRADMSAPTQSPAGN